MILSISIVTCHSFYLINIIQLRPEDWKDNPDKELLSYGGIETDHAKRGDL